MDLIPDWVPSGYKAVNASLVISDMARALKFYNSVFGAQVKLELKSPEGEVMFAQISVFDCTVMISSSKLGHQGRDPLKLGGTPVAVYLYVGDAEGVFEAAVAAGAEVLYPLQEQFYGDKAGRIRDPFGHEWIIARYLETIPNEELQKRFAKMFDA